MPAESPAMFCSATPTSINLRGYVSNDGGCPDMYNWFEYGSDANYGNETNPKPHNGVGYFSDDVYNLQPCTTYHFRAVARNNTLIESYGSDKTFRRKNKTRDIREKHDEITGENQHHEKSQA